MATVAPGSTTRSRQKVFLEVLSLCVPMCAATTFSGVFIAGWSGGLNLGIAAGVAAVLTACWLWHRSNHPPRVATISGRRAALDDASADDGRWDWFTLLLLGLSLVTLVIVGIVSRFVFPLAIIALIAIGTSGWQGHDLLAAVGCTLAVAFVLEFAVVIPLSRWWDLEFDDDAPRRQEFCPDP